MRGLGPLDNDAAAKQCQKFTHTHTHTLSLSSSLKHMYTCTHTHTHHHHLIISQCFFFNSLCPAVAYWRRAPHASHQHDAGFSVRALQGSARGHPMLCGRPSVRDGVMASLLHPFLFFWSPPADVGGLTNTVKNEQGMSFGSRGAGRTDPPVGAAE